MSSREEDRNESSSNDFLPVLSTNIVSSVVELRPGEQFSIQLVLSQFTDYMRNEGIAILFIRTIHTPRTQMYFFNMVSVDSAQKFD